jgi:2-oxoglutarate ferredoxin oxidoreductase subunit alpha
VGATIGAAFAGSLAVTGSSGPGIALKSEGISLAFMLELPLIIVNVQRGGPSTGLPTKPEQSDLLFSLYGRHGESPLPVLAIATPSEAFIMAIEAARIAVKYMTPVILLSDNAVANASEPWRLPDLDSIPEIDVEYAKHPNGPDGTFLPYMRNVDTFARPWAIPGTAGLEHRVGGLEKDALSGDVSYDPNNHQLMTDTRGWKVANIANDIPQLEINGDEDAEILVLGWGSTFGSIGAAANRSRLEGRKVATAHLRYLNPLPSNLGDLLRSYDKILIPELNTGQLMKVIRAEFLIDAIGLNKVSGEPFKISEIMDKIQEMVE